MIQLWALALILTAFADPLVAQNWNSNLEGVVLDPSSRAVPGAAVVLRNTATGLTRITSTGANGFYAFPLLTVGTYDLEVSKSGFASKTLAGLVLQVGQTARVDVTLVLARQQTMVRVDARPPLIETATPAIGDEIENARVSLLPLNGRQFSQLALLAAGAAPPYPNGSSQQFNTAAQGIGFSVNGQRAERNNFSLDGITLEPFLRYRLRVPAQ
ncbi:MAG: carboxypeptidase-like regulatory domain-containing protein [Acidobacteriia bacterium]|nr:carboxypeptidase-like regulatory domain-containing protein [Terriglobia bacterium]